MVDRMAYRKVGHLMMVLMLVENLYLVLRMVVLMSMVEMMAFHWVVHCLMVFVLVHSMGIAMEIVMVSLRDSLMVLWIV